MNELIKQLRPAIVALALLTLITGVIYPLVVTGVAQVIFPDRADGSLIERDGQIVGSQLIGQNFYDPAYFWSRVSNTGGFAYNAAAPGLYPSSGSNYGPLNPSLIGEGGAIDSRASALRDADLANTTQQIPVDLVTGSGSGLDPHISPAAADYQIERVAAARGLDLDAVRTLVEEYTEGRTFALLGEPRVNVLMLNLALDQAFGVPAMDEIE
jgi:potassium-transporting ATPase KdpC subunit